MLGRERVGGGLMKGAREEGTERGREGAWEEGMERGREEATERGDNPQSGPCP